MLQFIEHFLLGIIMSLNESKLCAFVVGKIPLASKYLVKVALFISLGIILLLMQC